MIPFLPMLASANPVGHVIDKGLITDPTGDIWYVSNVTLMLLVAALVTLAVLLPAARRITTGKTGTLEDLRTRGTLANIVEAICLYLRDNVFRSVLHDQTDKYAPMLWTFFWFILINNLLGLIPVMDATAGLFVYLGLFQEPYTYFGIFKVQPLGDVHHPIGLGGTATQSIYVTGTLATIAFLWFNFSGLKKDPVGFFKHLTGGAPIYMWIIMVPVEILGMFVKPIALALRLFANMTGGHIIIATLLGFVVALATKMSGVTGHGMALIPLLGSIAVMFLEILVAFIQAYIFTFLSCLFLGQLVVHHHDAHEEDEVGAHGLEVEPHVAPVHVSAGAAH